jgi:hypothetical protein
MSLVLWMSAYLLSKNIKVSIYSSCKSKGSTAKESGKIERILEPIQAFAMLMLKSTMAYSLCSTWLFPLRI